VRFPVPPLLDNKNPTANSVFEPSALLRQARRQKGIAAVNVPSVCILDPDGDIVRRLNAAGQAHLAKDWPCYHTELYTFTICGQVTGIVGCAVDAAFAVLIAEELFASGCRLLISMTSGECIAIWRRTHDRLGPASFVSAVIDRLSRRYPRIVFHLVATQSEMLRRELSDRTVDLLVTRKWGPIEERFDFEFLFDDSFVVVAGAQSPWVRRRTIALAELFNQPWVLPPPESLIGSVATEAFRASGLEYPRATVFTATAEVRMGLLATGRLLTILATSILRFPTRRRELKILPVELPIASVPNGIFTLKNRTLSPVARLFIEHAREVAKPLAKKKS